MYSKKNKFLTILLYEIKKLDTVQSESTGAGGHFFDDFTDFYKNPSERSFHNSVGEGQQQVKSFGASDGFPNFFEGNFNH